MPNLTLEQWSNAATIAATAIGLLGLGAIFYELRGSKQAANVQASLGFYSMWTSREMSDHLLFERTLTPSDYQDWLQRYKTDERPLHAVVSITNFFEMLGIACRTGGLSFNVAYSFFATIAVHYWDRYFAWITDRRVVDSSPGYLREFEWFADRCKKMLAHP